MKAYFRITPQGGEAPGDKHVAINDLIEFVDESGNAHDISDMVTTWESGAVFGKPRKLKLEVFGAEFGETTHVPPLTFSKWEIRGAAS